MLNLQSLILLGAATLLVGGCCGTTSARGTAGATPDYKSDVTALYGAPSEAYEVVESDFSRALDAIDAALKGSGFTVTRTGARAASAEKKALMGDTCQIEVTLSSYRPSNNFLNEFIRAEIIVKGWYTPTISKHPYGGLPTLAANCETARTLIHQALTPPQSSLIPTSSN